MHPPLDEWDEAYLKSIAGLPESGEMERKGNELFDPAKDKRSLREELAKQVCAFSNAGGGFLVYGIDKKGVFDNGVDDKYGREDMKSWAEAEIPRLSITPTVTTCHAKFIRVDGHHASGKGILVVHIPSSVHRPHWLPPSSPNHPGMPYIRAGEHSVPMNLQTFRDISIRGDTAEAKIESIGLSRGPINQKNDRSSFDINPVVKLTVGPICKDWGLEVKIDNGGFAIGNREGNAIQEGQRAVFVPGNKPLFLNRSTPVGTWPVRLILFTHAPRRRIQLSLFVSGGQPQTKEIEIGAFFGDLTRIDEQLR
jgi:hypothetical protein